MPTAPGKSVTSAAKRLGRWARWVPLALLLLPWLLGQTEPATTTRIRQIATPWSFQTLDWITGALSTRAERALGALSPEGHAADERRQMERFLTTSPSQRTGIRRYAEIEMERLVSNWLLENGVGHPVPGWERQVFPPVMAALTSPPNMLIVSPRDELRVAQSVMLLPALGPSARDDLEQAVESLGVSALVTPIGGLATYPSMVLEANSAGRMLDAIAHEWTHQYLIFYPLGQGYWASAETRNINETVADLVGREVAAGLARQAEAATIAPPPAGSSFDFRAYMRETRARVEQLLARGSIEEAEAYMEERRLGLEPHGFFIRRLNQAYFAFHGSYGESVAASPRSPIPQLVRDIRAQSASIGDFLARVRDVRTVEDLRATAS